MRTARDVVQLYNDSVWGKRDIVLAEELLGDTVIRHEVGETVVQTRAEAARRIVDSLALFDEIRIKTTRMIVGGDEGYVTLIYESPMRFTNGTEFTISSIEVFHVVDGRITEVWNCGYKQGNWH